ncbi:MAG TPA: ComEA family DNA-binding protein [Chloroflexi bacterium]|nr:ComEA family DNA-binding protein [Chloroflexota bacterium]
MRVALSDDAHADPDRMSLSAVEKARRARVEALLRIHAQARADAYADALARARRRLRGYVAALVLLSFGVGIVIGAYGLPADPLPQVACTAPTPAYEPPAFARLPMDDVQASWPLRVYVSGAVARTQVVTVPVGSRVADVLEAAGGPRPEADLEALNLAAAVADGQHVIVPTRMVASPVPQATAPLPAVLIDLNTASAAELEGLPYIGASRAAEIVAYREAHGPFHKPEDLLAVPGIGPTIYARIEPLVTVGP